MSPAGWDAGAALVCDSGQACALRENSGLEGKVESQPFQEQPVKAEQPPGRMESSLMLICEEKKVISDAFFHLRHLVFPPAPASCNQRGVLPQAMSLPAVSVDVVTCPCSLSPVPLGTRCLPPEAGLRRDRAALAAIKGSAQPPQLLALPSAA